jgi:aromatic-L-amino-acid decarboxylase
LLEVAINKDLKDGFTPLCVVATLGTTGCTSIDPVSDMATLCNKFGIWLHVDAAYAGTALLLPEYRYIIEGIERADSFVFNPHKWMFTNFDCSAYFIKDREALLRTFEILPEYLKTPTRGMVNDYRDWGVQLGRRFRALKLWFVIRSFGTDKLSEMIRNHIALAQWFRQQVELHPHFELMAPVTFSVVCFRFKPEKLEDGEQLNALNAQLLKKINASGKVYLSHTRLHNKFTLRLSIAGTLTGKEHVDKAWFLIQEIAAQSGDSV